jgi:raffinose/stachyose/melibiose transport system permease protein
LAAKIDFKNYKSAIMRGNLLVCYRNSFIITGATVILTFVFSSMASCVFALYDFRMKQSLFFYFVSGMMIPIAIIYIPLFKMLVSMKLYNTFIGMICIYIAKSLPFSILILTDYIRTIQKDIFESAEIDGATEVKKFTVIIVPLIMPALATVGIFTFRDVWNDYFTPLIFLRDQNLHTLQVGLSRFMGQFTTQWGMLYAGLNLVVIPLLILYFLMSKTFIRGITSGAVKE